MEPGLFLAGRKRDAPAVAEHLRTTPRQTAGRSQGELPADSALAPALAAIRGFYFHLADTGRAGPDVVKALFTTVPAPDTRHGMITLQRYRVSDSVRDAMTQVTAPADAKAQDYRPPAADPGPVPDR